MPCFIVLEKSVAKAVTMRAVTAGKMGRCMVGMSFKVESQE